MSIVLCGFPLKYGFIIVQMYNIIFSILTVQAIPGACGYLNPDMLLFPTITIRVVLNYHGSYCTVSLYPRVYLI